MFDTARLQQLHLSDEDNPMYFKHPPIENEKANTIKFMGYNLHTSFVTDADVHYPQYHSNIRSECVVKLFNEIKPHIAALVEFSPSQAVFLKNSLPNMRLVGFFSETKNSIEKTLEIIESDLSHEKIVGEAIAVLYDDSLFKLISIDCLNLPKGKRHERIATTATLEITASKTNIYIISTHLDHICRESKKKSLSLLADKIAELNSKGEILFYGDLNLFPDEGGDEDYLEFIEKVKGKLEDPVINRKITHYGPFGTFPGHESASDKFLPPLAKNSLNATYIPNSNRLDVLGVSPGIHPLYTYTINAIMNVDKKDFVLSGCMEGRLFPSDHMPIVCAFELSEQNK